MADSPRASLLLWSVGIAALFLGAAFFFGSIVDEHLAITTTPAEIEDTRFWTEGDHRAYAAVDVTNTGEEVGRICVHVTFENGHAHRRQECEAGVQPGETITITSSRHADGKSVTRRDIRNMHLNSVMIEP